MSRRYKFRAVIEILEGRRFSERALGSIMGGFSPNERFRISAKVERGRVRINVKAADAAMLHSVMNTLISTIKTLEKIDEYG